MKYWSKIILIALLVCNTATLFAQTGGRDFKVVDEYVKSLGDLDSMSMGTINNVVSNKFPDKIDRARAIYDWIAHNIKYDIKAAKSNNMAKNSTKEVLSSRKATGAGFAALFQDMCSSADIRCLTVDGFVKNNAEQINDPATDINHTWAVVQLGESPDEWYYVDPAWGSGYPDAEMKNFTKAFTDAYFFSEKAIFNLQHYPDNLAWKLGSAPKNKKDFYSLPVIKVVAQEMGMKKFSPNDGILKAKLTKAVNFNYTFNAKGDITSVKLIIKDRKKIVTKDMTFTFSGGQLSFTYKFEQEGIFPVTVLVNDKELMTYSVDVE